MKVLIHNHACLSFLDTQEIDYMLSQAIPRFQSDGNMLQCVVLHELQSPLASFLSQVAESEGDNY